MSAKAREGEIIVMDVFYLPEAKTKLAAAIFGRVAGIDGFARILKGKGVLVVLSGKNDMARRAVRNIPYAGLDEARNLNAYEALQYKYLMMPKEAINLFAKKK